LEQPILPTGEPPCGLSVLELGDVQEL
jgi:hypothetical protein